MVMEFFSDGFGTDSYGIAQYFLIPAALMAELVFESCQFLLHSARTSIVVVDLGVLLPENIETFGTSNPRIIEKDAQNSLVISHVSSLLTISTVLEWSMGQSQVFHFPPRAVDTLR
jgi:hypothetical protein